MAFKDTGEWKPEDDGVATRVAKITSGSSDYMRQARTDGMRAANRRGLGNSSMAVGAAQGAAISAAAPLAGQEAAQTAQKNQAFLEGGIRTDQLGMQIAAAEREALARSMTDLTGQRYSALAATLSNPDIPAEARAAIQRSINDQNQSALNYLQNLYGVSLSNTMPGGSYAPGTVGGGAQGYNPVPGVPAPAGQYYWPGAPQQVGGLGTAGGAPMGYLPPNATPPSYLPPGYAAPQPAPQPAPSGAGQSGGGIGVLGGHKLKRQIGYGT